MKIDWRTVLLVTASFVGAVLGLFAKADEGALYSSWDGLKFMLAGPVAVVVVVAFSAIVRRPYVDRYWRSILVWVTLFSGWLFAALLLCLFGLLVSLLGGILLSTALAAFIMIPPALGWFALKAFRRELARANSYEF